MTNDDKYPEILREIALTLKEALVALPADEFDPEKKARALTEALRQRFSGELLYIPKGVSHDALQKHYEVWRKYTGDNVPQLAKEFRLSEVYIYQIIRRMRELEREKSQSKLNF